jgi:HEPN domain-containing protein
MKTAVGWLLFELSKNGLLPDGIPDDIYEQAKEMEKEQIGDAYERGFNQGYRDPEFLNTNDSDDEY